MNWNCSYCSATNAGWILEMLPSIAVVVVFVTSAAGARRGGYSSNLGVQKRAVAVVGG